MKRLKETNLIKTDVEGISVKYSIDDSASAIVGRYASTLIQITS